MTPLKASTLKPEIKLEEEVATASYDSRYVAEGRYVSGVSNPNLVINGQNRNGRLIIELKGRVAGKITYDTLDGKAYGEFFGPTYVKPSPFLDTYDPRQGPYNPFGAEIISHVSEIDVPDLKEKLDKIVEKHGAFFLEAFKRHEQKIKTGQIK
jgi:hypothetical protein